MNDVDLKQCPFCAEKIQAAAIFCRFCNRDLPGAASSATTAAPVRAGASRVEPPQNAQVRKASSGRRWAWVAVIVGLTIIASLNGQNLFTFVTGTLTGQVVIDTNKLTNTITKGVKEQTGLDVKVTCPSPFIGHVGDTRKCSYTSLMGPGFIDVTIQSTSGDITWQGE